jgi:hypothetical protein
MASPKSSTLAPSALELAILGELWVVGGTCATLTALALPGRSSLRQRRLACERLTQRGWLTYAQPIAQAGLSLTGKTLLRLDLSVWPVTPDELWILRSCQAGRIGPEQIHRRVPVAARQRLLERLTEQGLIVVYERAIADLSLTATGRQRAAVQLAQKPDQLAAPPPKDTIQGQAQGVK